MTWTLLIALVAAVGLALLFAFSRRHELARMERLIRERDRALRAGNAQAQLQHPVIDLTRCLGCGSCVSACPEQGVLELVHGQALVVNGALCVGHARCETACPVGAVSVALADLAERTDIPNLGENLEARGSPGLFLAGEVTAHALIKTAVEHGTAVAAEVDRRVRRLGHGRGAAGAGAAPRQEPLLDLCIVGAGPAGLACALEAKRLGLSAEILDQETDLGGTVAKYPRRKLVLSRPVELPLHGPLPAVTTKEELIELWRRIAREQDLRVRGGERFLGLERVDGRGYLVRTNRGEYGARHVCLALGRRGTPRTLGVAGEDLPKVAYALLDAHSYEGRRILVVGGGDSAVEAALALAEQRGNVVTLSYRGEAFHRIRTRTQERLERALAGDRLALLLGSRVVRIDPGWVDLELEGAESSESRRLANDEVFVMIGGEAPIPLLKQAGVSFDPSQRPPTAAPTEQGTGLLRALTAGFAVVLGALAFVLWNADYYLLDTQARAESLRHAWLRPGAGIGLAFGLSAAGLVGVNLLYLARRSGLLDLRFGSLRAWMSSHVATGILALVLAALHSAMAPGDSLGGHALLALVLLFASGAVGRYFYAYVPRAANGRELELAEVKLEMARLFERWDRAQRAYAERVRVEVEGLVSARQWRASPWLRAWALVRGRGELRRALRRLGDEGRRAGVPAERVAETLHIARQAHGIATAAAHYEELRSLLNAWRYVHRWVAVLLVLLLALHIGYTLVY